MKVFVGFDEIQGIVTFRMVCGRTDVFV